jgi:hypothetical protein
MYAWQDFQAESRVDTHNQVQWTQWMYKLSPTGAINGVVSVAEPIGLVHHESTRGKKYLERLLF